MRKVVFGCGYLGRRVAKLWRDQGDDVVVVTRSEERKSQFETQGYEAVVADIVRRQTLQQGALQADVVLFAVGYDRQSGHAIEDVYVQGQQNVLEALENVQRFIYISSTGVYGHTQGEWVDEESVCEPLRAGGKACLAAEQQLLKHAHGKHAVILRLAGIYGPARVPRRADLESGEPVVASSGYLNLIHVDDAAQVVLAAEGIQNAPRAFVVSDGESVLRREYYCEVARQLGLSEPTFEDPPVGSNRRGMGSKRINNARMRGELKVDLAFPSYREGLAHALVG